MLKRFGQLILGAAVMLACASPLAAAETKITLLLTNDIYKLEGSGPRGGFARLAGVVKAERGRGGHVVYVHAGDTISPSLMAGFDQGEHVIDLLNMAPPDIFVPGNHEYDFGPDVFRKRMAALNSTKLAANLRDASGKPLDGFGDTTMLQLGEVKLGIVGLTADDSPVKSSPGDLKFTATVDTAIAKAKELKDAGADMVVAVVHASRSQDRELFDSGAFDVILTGDDHDLALFFDGKTAMAESKEEAEYVTAIDVSVTIEEKDGRRRVSWWPNFRIIDTATVSPDAATADKTKAYEAALSSELDVSIGATKTALDSRKATVRSSETPIGNLIADAMRAAVGADIAITNGGGIRGNKEYAAGTELTRRDILTELPFGNRTLLLDISGADILAGLENGVSKVEDSAGRFPHVSGITVEADLTKPAGSRIVSVKVADAPLDPASRYKLATNDYMAGGGDGYSAFRNGKQLLGVRDAKLMANDVMAYIKQAGSVAPKIEGRVSLKR